MPPRPPAHLMLPSPLGLLEYDVLEDAVFLGPGRKGGLRAGPTPFKGAQVALKRGAEGFVARPLPGEAPPEINGEVVEEHALADGDRIRLGDQVAMFRTTRGALAPKPAPAAEPEPTPLRQPRVERRQAPRRSNPTAAIVMFTGLILLLAAAYRAANHAKALSNADLAGDDLPELEAYQPQEPGRIAAELKALNDEALARPKAFAELIPLFRDFQRRHEGTDQAETAGERIRELMTAWSTQERAAVEAKAQRLVEAQQFARALEAVRQFESRFGMTAAGDIEGLRLRIRTEAEARLEQLIAKVSPLIRRQPREAHRMLISVSHEFPPDMASRVVRLVELCVQRMIETTGRPPRRANPPRRDPGKPGPGDGARPPRDVAPKKDKGADPVPAPNAEEERKRDEQCADAWSAARKHLLEANWAEALQAYTLVQQQYGNTAFFRHHKARIAAGRRAARAGALGPEALVGVPVEKKKGRLEMEYHFNNQHVFDEDWTLEQPFASAMPVRGRWKKGAVTLEKATGMLHRLVYLADVRVEARVTVHQPHDFGLLAVEESDDFRAVLFNIANTQFKLKKGDAARANKGHVLWYIGQGVWKDADKDAHGFIKIAERAKVSLESGDRIQLELIRTKDSAEGTLQGKTDGVNLKGKVKGDDGSTMGSARVGLFTNSGIIVVESVRISGRVDMEWFRKELAFMVAGDPGPPEND